MAMRRPAALRSQAGFTLIEVLVVGLILATLAAIALPAFLSQTAKANDTDAKSVARTAELTMYMYFADHESFDVDVAGLRALEPSLSSGLGTTLQVSGSEAGHSIVVTSRSNGHFNIRREGAVTERTCDSPGKGGCPAGGKW